MHITFVKKILDDGNLCRKCQEVNDRLEADDLFQHINHIAVADARNAHSEGMIIATKHQVDRAPFFVVEHQGETVIFDVFFKFKKFLAEQGLVTSKPKSL